MDCRTARLLLDLTRPTSHELDGEESQALEGHLATCPDCSELARVERDFHRRVGLAICQVQVPPNLRTKVLILLNKERSDYYRRQVARGGRVAAALAACLLVALLVWYRQADKKPVFNVESVSYDLLTQQLFDPSQQKVNEFLAYHKVAAPDRFKYKYLRHYGMIECQGKQVPFLLFVLPEQNLSARVYIVSDRQFDLASLQNQGRSGTGGYSTEVWRPDGADYAYVIVYTGEDIKPFLLNEDGSAT